MALQTQPMNAQTSPRKGRRAGVASELSIFLKVKPGHEKQLRDHFANERDDPQFAAESQKILEDVGTLHDSRFVLFDDDTRLLVATSFDGDWDIYIDDFARTNVLRFWSTFLIHCEGVPDSMADASALSVDDWKEILTAHQATAAEYARTYPDLSVKQILKAQRVMATIQQLLDEASS